MAALLEKRLNSVAEFVPLTSNNIKNLLIIPEDRLRNIDGHGLVDIITRHYHNNINRSTATKLSRTYEPKRLSHRPSTSYIPMQEFASLFGLSPNIVNRLIELRAVEFYLKSGNMRVDARHFFDTIYHAEGSEGYGHVIELLGLRTETKRPAKSAVAQVDKTLQQEVARVKKESRSIDYFLTMSFSEVVGNNDIAIYQEVVVIPPTALQRFIERDAFVPFAPSSAKVDIKPIQIPLQEEIVESVKSTEIKQYQRQPPTVLSNIPLSVSLLDEMIKASRARVRPASRNIAQLIQASEPIPVSDMPLARNLDYKIIVGHKQSQDAYQVRPIQIADKSNEIRLFPEDIYRLFLAKAYFPLRQVTRELRENGRKYTQSQILKILKIAGVDAIKYKGNLVFPPNTTSILAMRRDELKKIGAIAREYINKFGPYVPPEIVKLLLPNFDKEFRLDFLTKKSEGVIGFIEIGATPFYDLFTIVEHYGLLMNNSVLR